MQKWIAALSLCFACASPTRVAREAAPGEAPLTLLTYNVNYGLAGDAPGIAAIAATNADIVLLQETNPEWEAELRAALGEQYPHIYFHHVGAAGGSAVLSKYPLTQLDVVGHPVKGSWFPTMIAVVDTPQGEVQLANVHLRPPLSDSGNPILGFFTTSDVRRAEMRNILKRLNRDLPTIVAGDFNESSGGALGVLQEAGFENGGEAFGVDRDTWRWNTSVGEIGSRLDHVVYDGRIDPLQIEVVEAGRSDHLPVVARIVVR